MAYIEETVDKLREAVTDFKVEVAGRLGSIETEQRATNEQLRKINGSVQRSADRLNTLESEDRAVDREILELKECRDKHEESIKTINLEWAFTRGKVFGLSLAVSVASSGAFLLIQWWLRSHGH